MLQSIFASHNIHSCLRDTEKRPLSSLFLSVRLSDRLSVCSHGIIRLPLDGFSLALVFEGLSKIYPKNASSIKIWQKLLIVYMKTRVPYIHDDIALGSYQEGNVSYQICRENQNIFCVQIRIFNAYVKSVLLYGCETWLVTNEIQRKIQTFVNRCLRYIQ